MKNIALIISGLLLSTMLLSQAPNRITTVDTTCFGIDLTVDGAVLTQSNQCVYETPQVVTGPTYTLEAVDDGSGSLVFISTLDLVSIQAGLFIGFDDPLDAYRADFDQDGAVSTYDLVEMRAVILGITPHVPEFHVVDANSLIPNIDPLDIQVDYSTLEFTTDDYDSNGELKVQILRIGDLR